MPDPSLPRRAARQRPYLSEDHQPEPPPGLVQRPSLELLARVRAGLQALEEPGVSSEQNSAPSWWKGMWE